MIGLLSKTQGQHCLCSLLMRRLDHFTVYYKQLSQCPLRAAPKSTNFLVLSYLEKEMLESPLEITCSQLSAGGTSFWGMICLALCQLPSCAIERILKEFLNPWYPLTIMLIFYVAEKSRNIPWLKYNFLFYINLSVNVFKSTFE